MAVSRPHNTVRRFVLSTSPNPFLHHCCRRYTLCYVLVPPTNRGGVIEIRRFDYITQRSLQIEYLMEFYFGAVNTIASAFIILITLLNIIVYKVRQIQEANLEGKSENIIRTTSEQHQDGNLGEASSSQSTSLRSEHLCRRFSFCEILHATNNFDDILVIGKGGFGKVYKGVIDNGEVTVAIKRLKLMSKQGAPQFWSEVQLLSRFRHSHLVSLIGYCNDRNEMILVYEYMPRRSLADHLFKGHSINNNNALITLSWIHRLKICIGAAQGLDYLHTGTGINSRVIHRDVKSSNILLDDSWAAKVSDFGLSKIGPANQNSTHVSTNVQGTFGYLDPEYMMTRRLTRKSDVYSFGIILLEVLSGKRAMDPKLCEEHWGLAGWAKDCVKKGEPDQIIDPYLKYEINPSSLKEYVQITEKCLHYRSRKRPTMAEVVASLEHVLALQERIDSSMLAEDFKNLGWTTMDNQENLDDSLEVNDDARNSEVIDDAGNSEPIDDASNVQSRAGLGLGLVLPGGGVVLGAVYGELLRLIIDPSRTSYLFKSKLDHIKMTLAALKPKIDRIVESNIDPNHPNEDISRFVEKLVAGNRLIVKCSKIKRWNVVGKQEYSRKLTAFWESLLWFMQVDIQADLVLDTKKILLEVDSIRHKLDTISSVSKNGSGGGYCDVPGLPDLIVGLYEPLMELKKMILDNGVSVVVLSAPGGTGKTTLSKMLCKDKEIQGIYGSNTLFVTVAQRASLKDIVGKIFQHYSFSLPLFQNDEDLMNQLESLMSRVVAGGPIMLIFDDVWSDWYHHIQNFNFGMENFKILVTSRFVFPKCDRKYKLNKLSSYDATTLFCHSALRNGGNSEVPDELVSEIVKGCRGSPLALTVVGRSLYDQPAVIWKNTVKRWSEGESIFHSNKKELLLPLQTSLDAFEENDIAKDCYLDLGLFPEDHKIPITLLVDMWVELYGKYDDDILEILLKLSFRNLVNLLPMRKDTVEVDGYCNEYYVMNHDLYRELAIYQTNQESIEQRRRLFLEIRANAHPKWCIEQQQPNCARLVSISTDETFASTWYNIQLPSTEVLILNFNSTNYALPPFIETMNRLKVIILTNYGSFPVELINFHILTHSYNLKRIRFQRISIPSLTTFLIQLQNLQKISFTMCEISNAFASCTSETANIFPNLTELEIDYSDDLVEFPVGLCYLLRLRKLSITYCSELIAFPDEFGRLVNMERLRIGSCAKLEELPESICGLHKLTFLDISGCTRMSRLPEQIGKLKKLKVLRMGCVGKIQDYRRQLKIFVN